MQFGQPTFLGKLDVQNLAKVGCPNVPLARGRAAADAGAGGFEGFGGGEDAVHPQRRARCVGDVWRSMQARRRPVEYPGKYDGDRETGDEHRQDDLKHPSRSVQVIQ